MVPKAKEHDPFIVWFLYRCIEHEEDEMEDQVPISDREFVGTLLMIVFAVLVFVLTIGPLRIL